MNIRHTLAYNRLRLRLLRKIGIRGARLASALLDEVRKFGNELATRTNELRNKTAEELAPMLIPYAEKAAVLVQRYWRQPVLVVLRNDKAVERFARFTYALFPEPVRSVVTRKTFISACKHCRDYLVRSLQSEAQKMPDAVPAVVPATAVPDNDDPLSSAAADTRISSVPSGAEIEIDGAFIGNTPSQLPLAPGQHRVCITKSGYEPWQKTVSMNGGQRTIHAELEPRLSAGAAMGGGS